jgi:hypothetical protein
VNTYTTNYQGVPAVAADGAGNFVVVWQSPSAGSDTSDLSIQGQRYDSSGTPQGVEFQVNTYTTSSQRLPAVAMGAAGSFVVLWQSLGSAGSDTSDHSIQGQRYDGSGAPQGKEFQVNTYTTSYQSLPAAAMQGGGSFVVVWRSDGSAGSDASNLSVQGQRLEIQ